MARTDGGCCDCGDPSAWSRAGFCNKHTGPSEDPSVFLPARMQPTIRATVRAAVAHVEAIASKLLQTDEANKPSKEELRSATLISTRLADLCKTLGDGVTRAVATCFCATPDADSTAHEPLSTLILADHKYRVRLRAALHTLYFRLLGDQFFKNCFARLLAQHYATLYGENPLGCHAPGTTRQGGVHDDVLSLSVQVFTIKGAMRGMIEKTRLLEVLTDAAISCLTPAAITPPARAEGAAPGPQTINLKNRVIRRQHFWRVFMDLRFVLQQSECASIFLFGERPQALDSFLKLTSLLQGVDTRTRYAGPRHVTHESTTWVEAFDLAGEYMQFLPLILAGVAHAGSGAAAEFPRSALREHVLALIIRFSVPLRPWLAYMLGDNPTPADPLTMPVTLHLPLHRLLVSLMREAVALCDESTGGAVSLVEAFTSAGVPPAHLAEHPLRIMAWLAQVRCGAWAKNGETLPWLCEHFQTSSRTAEVSYDNDILCLQIASLQLGPRRFADSLFNRFSASYGVQLVARVPDATPVPEVIASPRCLSMLEEVLSLAVIIATDRNRCGARSAEQALRRKIVHLLCVCDLTYSQIAKKVPPEQHSLLDTVLAAVAEKHRTAEGEQYALKRACWGEYDPYYTHYKREKATKAEERYFQQLGHPPHRSPSARATLLRQQKTPPCPSLTPALPAFAGVAALLRARVFSEVAYAILYGTARTGEGCPTERMLVLALHLLSLAVKAQASGEKFEDDSTFEDSALAQGLRLPSACDVVANAKCELTLPGAAAPASILSLLLELGENAKYVEHSVAIAGVLKQFGELDAECHAQVAAHARAKAAAAQQKEESSITSAAAVTPGRQRLLDRKRRQQEIMQQFAARQQAFKRQCVDAATEKGAAASTAGDDEDDEVGEELVCVMCRERVTSRRALLQKPVALIALVQRSTLLPTATEHAAKGPDPPSVQMPEPPAAEAAAPSPGQMSDASMGESQQTPEVVWGEETKEEEEDEDEESAPVVAVASAVPAAVPTPTPTPIPVHTPPVVGDARCFGTRPPPSRLDAASDTNSEW
eukprot:TRINITY_DN865_c1_g7_i2.p1 TRINITY_DN865_c1_g7~~TRINITY_DN865_c1_g7_i2.p1  ORF type:complete len:1180 (-),score=289.37 TRINITY_DN865_c1_g7_i2:334-3489(-)